MESVKKEGDRDSARLSRVRSRAIRNGRLVISWRPGTLVLVEYLVGMSHVDVKKHRLVRGICSVYEIKNVLSDRVM